MGPDAASRAAHRLLCGRLAGVLFAVGALASIPVNQLFEPGIDDRWRFVTAVGFVSGVICLLLPWDRLAARWFHVLPPVASFEVALTMWGVGEHAEAYLWFLVFITVFVALAFDARRAVAGHLATVLVVAAYPLVVTGAGERAQVLAETLVAVPILLVAAFVVVHLRERLTAAVTALAAEATTDPLTGVGNRRLFEQRLTEEAAAHRRDGETLALVALDLDGFKQVNDTLGHPAGDQLLRDVAATLVATVRPDDLVVRPGGDEFCVVAPRTNRWEAAALADEIRVALSGLVAGGTRVSAAVGCATFPHDATSPELLLAQADLEQRRDKAAAGAVRRGALSVVRG